MGLSPARPDFAELDVFLGQLILFFILIQKCLDHIPTPRPNLNHE